MFTNQDGVFKCYYGVTALEGTIFSTRLKQPLNLNRVYLVRYATEYLQYFKTEYYKKEQQHDNNPKSAHKTNKQTKLYKQTRSLSFTIKYFQVFFRNACLDSGKKNQI